MIEWAAILKSINAQGVVGLAVALLLALGWTWSGCSLRAERDAYRGIAEECERELADCRVLLQAWKDNADQWERDAIECSRRTEAYLESSLRNKAEWESAIRVAESEARASKLELRELRRQVEAGEISVRELLKQVQVL